MFLRAETRELVAHLKNVYVQEVMERLDQTLARHPSLQAYFLEWPPLGEGECLQTDPVVLHRVLLNMAVNALEASAPGDSVRFWLEWREGRPCFFVHNPGVIPEMIQPRIFQRPFSTKRCKGRGTCFHVDLPTEEGRGRQP